MPCGEKKPAQIIQAPYHLRLASPLIKGFTVERQLPIYTLNG